MCVFFLVERTGWGGGGARCLRPCFDVGPIVLNPNKIVIKSYLFFSSSFFLHKVCVYKIIYARHACLSFVFINILCALLKNQILTDWKWAFCCCCLSAACTVAPQHRRSSRASPWERFSLFFLCADRQFLTGTKGRNFDHKWRLDPL